MRRRLAHVLIGPVAASLAFVGCDSRRPTVVPTSPSPVPTQPPGPSTLKTYSVAGDVLDTAFRPLPGARVEVVSGSHAGAVVATDDEGHFTLGGEFSGDTTLVASKEGYRSQTYVVSSERFSNASGEIHAWARFYLESPEPIANLTGTYSFTITADSACSNLPDELRTRTYTASAIHGERPGLFVGSLSDARFMRYTACSNSPSCTWTLNRFSIGVAGDFATVLFTIVEALGEKDYLLIDAFGQASIAQSGITSSLEGLISYCPSAPTLIDQGTFGCLEPGRVQCESGRHRLALVRR